MLRAVGHEAAMTREGRSPRQWLSVVVSGAMPQLGMREVERVTGRELLRLGSRIGLMAVEPGEVRSVLALLYECVLLQEVLLAKAWATNPRPDVEFYRELAASSEWSEVEGRSFAVRVRKLGGFPPASSIELAARVGDAVYDACGGRCRIDLSKPELIVKLVASAEAAVVGVLLLKPRGDRFRLRSSRFKPFTHPASLTPEDARILVNLAAADGRILDPFCGTGSILAEAVARGLEAVGVDLNEEMARGAWRNLKHFSCDALCDVLVSDARMLPFRESCFDAVAADPPYGRLAPTHGLELNSVYERLISESARVLRDRGSLVFIKPEGSGVPRSLEKVGEGLKYLERYPVYVHSGLTRVICLVPRLRAAIRRTP
ncbi:MAG: methyltransferase domain-containing protein [Thermoproteales archaeon]|nr:methyltransferase domain-containing protein [Thermoproteales archaeon]